MSPLRATLHEDAAFPLIATEVVVWEQVGSLSVLSVCADVVDAVVQTAA